MIILVLLKTVFIVYEVELKANLYTDYLFNIIETQYWPGQ